MIYFLQMDNDDGLIKIGYTRNFNTLDSRISILQNSNPYKISCIGTIEEGTRDDEKKLHRLFSDYRKNGEWFYPNQNILKAIPEPINITIDNIDLESVYQIGLHRYIREIERKIVQSSVSTTKTNIEASRKLKISKASLSMKLKQYNKGA